MILLNEKQTVDATIHFRIAILFHKNTKNVGHSIHYRYDIS